MTSTVIVLSSENTLLFVEAPSVLPFHAPFIFRITHQPQEAELTVYHNRAGLPITTCSAIFHAVGLMKMRKAHTFF